MKSKQGNFLERRRLLTCITVGGAAGIAMPAAWVSPIINSVVLPAHAQTSAACVTDAQAGGPLLGNASGATSCQAACEAEAATQGAQLCSVTETIDSASAVQCGCDLDLP
jgi:hypothetical protein